MNPLCMIPLGKALTAYYRGDTKASLVLRRDDGRGAELPAAVFLSEIKDFPQLEKTALDRCRGTVLDVGAGAGRHSLELQRRGLDVRAIDVCADAVEVMKKRGVKNAACRDVYSLLNQSFDTVLLLMHGMGIAESENHVDLFLRKCAGLLNPGGRILVDSLDVRKTKEQAHLEYQKALVARGKYRGDVTMRLEYRGETGPWYGWLHCDPETLATHCGKNNLKSTVVFEDVNGDYLAEVVKP